MSATARHALRRPRAANRPGRSHDWRGKAEFLDSLKRESRAVPSREQHVALPRDDTHSHAEVEQWLSRSMWVMLHCTLSGYSRLNRVVVVLEITTRPAIGRLCPPVSHNSSPRPAGPWTTGTSVVVLLPGGSRPTRSCRTPAGEIQTRDTSDRARAPCRPCAF